jgi:hypothetical protein
MNQPTVQPLGKQYHQHVDTLLRLLLLELLLLQLVQPQL